MRSHTTRVGPRSRVSRQSQSLRAAASTFGTGCLVLAFLCTFAGASSDCCLQASLSGDPHCVGAHGDRFDVRGDHKGTYCLLSDSAMSLNARFEHVMFDSHGVNAGEFYSEDAKLSGLNIVFSSIIENFHNVENN